MADRGKIMMSAEELQREREEEERRQRREENMNRCWGSQRNTAQFPVVPPGQHRKGLGEPSSYESRARVLLGTYLGVPRSPRVPTDRVDPQDLHEFWKKTPAPTPPDVGLWYRFVDGYDQFCYGASWDRLNQREKEMAIYIEKCRAEGVIEVPAAPRPDEVMLYIMENTGEIVRLAKINDDDDPMEFLEPVEEEEETEEDIEEEVEEEIVEFVSEKEEEEDNDDDDDSGEDEVRGWSDTSTITKSPSQVPRSRRQYLRRGPGKR